MNCFGKWISRYFPVIQIVFILVWLSNLAATDSYFSVYVILAFLSFYLILRRKENCVSVDGWKKAGLILLSSVFSFAVLLANYPLFTTLGDPALIGRSTSILMNLINSLLTFAGGICAAYPILNAAFFVFPLPGNGCPQKVKWVTPLLVFLSIVCINLIHLFLVEYPGNLTEDTFTQISEMISGSYSNFNTFWHTLILQGIFSVGYSLFGNLNAAVALFCVLQTIVLAFAFTYTLMTMHQYGVPRAALVAVYLIYGVLPYNMALSITIWKDVLFAAGCLLTLTAWMRIQKRLSLHTVFDYLVFVFGSLVVLLARTNGWIIYCATFVIVGFFIRRNRKLLALMGSFAVLGWFLLNPALSMLGVPGGDLAESLSIPIQQVSRVVADGCELTAEEETLLSHVVDLEEVPQLYTNWISDPMKVELRSKDYSYFQEHFEEYVQLWIRLGLKHPWEYVKAWVDQTKGYWNGGYDYAMYSETVTDNPYGVEKTGGGNIIASLFRLYFGLSRHLIFFEPLHSIGLHIWLLILCFLVNGVKKREVWMLCVPLLILVVGLWLGTPVYSCFRYAYPIFVCLPLLLTTTLFSGKE